MLEAATAADLRLAALPAMWRLYERMDRLRARQGEWLEKLGWGPDQTPSRPLLRHQAFTLKAYGEADGPGAVVLLVPAPIKRSYIWDLAPEVSVVRACLKRGLSPYLIHWEEPDAEDGLEAYIGFVVEAIQAVRRQSGEDRVALAAHSLGGILAAILSSLHPDLVGGLVVIEAPLHFGLSRQEGALGPVIEAAYARGWLQGMPQRRLPGSLLSQAGLLASPLAFGQERWQDWVRSLPEAGALKTLMQVERWSLDEMPLAGRLIDDLVHGLYLDNGFIGGQLKVGERTAAASRVVAPLLLVLDRQCPVVPPAAMLPFQAAAASAEKRLLWYDGDVGVGIRHLGALIGRNAHARLWPQILDWLASLSAARS